MTEDFFQPCPSGLNLCASKMSVDWLSGGDQTITFSRSCSAKEINFGQECTEFGNTGHGQKLVKKFPNFSLEFKFLTEFKVGLFKDCETSCNTPNCNANNDVELLYSNRDENGDPRDLHCYEYAMDKLNKGGLSSYEDDNVPNSDWYVRKCPRWANQGCFRGNQIWNEGSNPFLF